MAGQNGEIKYVISADGTTAIAASQKVADAYKTLGTRSIADINTQKAQVAAAYEAIGKSGVASAQEIQRAEQAKNAQIKRLNEELVGNSQTWTSQIKQHWLGLAAGIGTAMIAINKGAEYMELGAKALQVEAAFKSVADSSKANADAFLANMERLTAGTMTRSEITQKALKGVTQGLSLEDMAKIGEMARQAARTQGIDVQEAYERLTDSIANQLPRAMKQFGLITQQQMLLINKAIASGVPDVNMLTIAYDGFLVKQAKMGPATDNASEAIQRNRARIRELREEIGVGLVDALTAAVALWDKLGQYGPKLPVYGPGGWSTGPPTGAPGSPIRMPVGTPYAAPEDPQEKMKRDLADLASRANADKVKQLDDAFKAWSDQVKALNPLLSETDKEMMRLTDQAEKFRRGQPGVAPGSRITIPESKIQGVLATGAANLEMKRIIENAEIEAKMDEEALARGERNAKEYEALYKEVGGARVSAEEAALTKIKTEEDEFTNRIIADYMKGAVQLSQIPELVAGNAANADRKMTELAVTGATRREEIANKEALNTISFQEKMGGISPAQAASARLQESQNYLASLDQEKAKMEAIGDTNGAAWDALLQKIEAAKKPVEDFTVANQQYSRTFAEGLIRGTADYIYSVKTAFGAGQELAKTATASMEKSFMEFLDVTSKGFSNWRDLILNIATDIERALLRAVFVQPAVGAMSGMMTSALSGNPSLPSLSSLGPIGAGLAKLFGPSGSGVAGSVDMTQGIAGFAGSEADWATAFHGGGMAWEPTSRRMVTTSAFSGARRAHTGLGPDELPVIVKNDEGIFTPGQMAAMAPVANQTPNFTVNVQNNNGSKVSTSPLKWNSNLKEWVVGVMIDDHISRGPYWRTKQVMGQ